MKTARTFMRFYIVPIVLLVGILLAVGFTLYYTTTAQTRDGKTVAGNWPKDLTLSFAKHIVLSEDAATVTVTEEGKALLTDNGLWLQVLDASGGEVLRIGAPAGTPRSYRPYALLEAYQYGVDGSSVFVSSVALDSGAYPYLIGFPMRLSKIVMYVDNARFTAGRALVIAIAALTALLVVTLTVYSFRTFLFAERRRMLDDKAKEEWLANITHDLKTPLAPIRGYAELLSEGDALSAQDARRYGAILLKNALFAEQLVDDLKLTYQLQSNMLPLRREARDITRFVREIVIDMLNTPEYEGREILFHADSEGRICSFDAQLLRRALANILVNALKHNQRGTQISVSIDGDPCTRITVADKGKGMTAQELSDLFKRYYRGTSTEVKTEGSGLGMAIAREIVEAHGGSIAAESKPESGTTITLEFPASFKV